MEQVERDKLRKEWNSLNEARKGKSVSLADKAIMKKRMIEIEKSLSRGIDVDAVLTATEIISVSVSVFEGTSGYRGPTTSGTSLGEGCYHKRWSS
jgi:hypothetical protein